MTKKKIIFGAVIFVILAVITSIYFIKRAPQKAEMLYDWNFSEGQGSFVTGAWKVESGVTDFSLDNEKGIDGSACVVINSKITNDARYELKVVAKPKAYYKISGWVRTENVPSTAHGANLSILGLNDVYGNIKGTSDWTKVEFFGQAGKDQTEFILALRLGGYFNETTGTAYFDNIQVEKLSSKPSGVGIASLEKVENASDVKDGVSYTEQDVSAGGLVIFSLTVLIFCLAYRLLISDKNEIKQTNIPTLKYRSNILITVLVVLLIGLIFRLAIAIPSPGYWNDINLFKYWATNVAKGIPNFYVNIKDVDYPPGYMYILYVVGKVASIFKISNESPIMMILIKLPAIICDILIGYFIYRICDLKMKKGWTVFFVAIWIFNPLVIMDSSMWGQVDSVLTLFILMAVYNLTKGKTTLASVFFAISVLIKMQGLIFLPILFFALVKKRNLMSFVKAFSAFFGTTLLIALPYAVNMPISWIFSLFANTAGGYKYATINAMNFFYLAGLNWIEDSKKMLGLSYLLIGMIFIVATTLFVWYCYEKSEKKPQFPYIYGAALMMGVFTFGPRMHERYFFPALALLLVGSILANNKLLFYLFIGISTTGFFNMMDVLAPISVGINKFLKVDLATSPIAMGNILISILLFAYIGYKVTGRSNLDNSFWGVVNENEN